MHDVASQLILKTKPRLWMFDRLHVCNLHMNTLDMFYC